MKFISYIHEWRGGVAPLRLENSKPRVMRQDELAKLNALPLITGSAGVVILATMWAAVATPGWLKGTALYDDVPITAHLSLTHVMLDSGSLRFCGEALCPLIYMCDDYEVLGPFALPVCCAHCHAAPSATPATLYRQPCHKTAVVCPPRRTRAATSHSPRARPGARPAERDAARSQCCGLPPHWV